MRVNVAGRSITIDSFYVTRTYGGMLEGLPTSDINTHLVESAKKKIAKLWGDRQTHVVKPTIKPFPMPEVPADFIRRHGDPEMLPKFQCHAWLDSDALTKEGHGSGVVLIWWADETEAFSIPELVEEALRGIKWESVAEDYEV